MEMEDHSGDGPAEREPLTEAEVAAAKAGIATLLSFAKTGTLRVYIERPQPDGGMYNMIEFPDYVLAACRLALQQAAELASTKRWYESDLLEIAEEFGVDGPWMYDGAWHARIPGTNTPAKSWKRDQEAEARAWIADWNANHVEHSTQPSAWPARATAAEARAARLQTALESMMGYACHAPNCNQPMECVCGYFDACANADAALATATREDPPSLGGKPAGTVSVTLRDAGRSQPRPFDDGPTATREDGK